MNTGRFVGSRSKNSTGRLEDTITKNNLEAVKEVVRQLRLRDIGGIIVIDFIDMANPKNRATVEEALRTELERDRTKTYVVEISPLGLVEMTRQNVTDGPREILTKKCPTCAGDGIVLSEASAALEVERRLRTLARRLARSGVPDRGEPEDRVAPRSEPAARGSPRSRRRRRSGSSSSPKEGVHADHAAVLAEGKLVDLQPEAPIAEGAEIEVKLVEVDQHDAGSAVGKLDGLDVVVGGAAKLVGKKAKVRVERVLDGVAYAALLAAAETPAEPITFESEAEKPTRAPSRAKKATEPEAEEAERAKSRRAPTRRPRTVELELGEAARRSRRATTSPRTSRRRRSRARRPPRQTARP